MIERLSLDLLKEIYEHAQVWNTENRLQDLQNASSYLEDCVANCNSDLTILLAGMTIEGRPFSREYIEQFKRRVLQRTCFFTNVLLRYFQKTIGLPKELQQIDSYNTETGNQIDDYLSEFFKI